MPRLRVGLILGVMALGAVSARADETATVAARLRAREETLNDSAAAAANSSRQHLLLAYRLSQRRHLGFLANPVSRREDAQAANAALFMVRRSLTEARVYADEAARAKAERAAFEEQAKTGTGAQDAGVGQALVVAPGFRVPVRGPVVGGPGVRVDPATGAELRRSGVQILARMNEPVFAVQAGIVRQIVALPQGGFAVVMGHADGWTSIVSGLRLVQATEGSTVSRGQALGLVGRNLDGAPVVTWELWRHRHPVTPVGSPR